MGAPGPDAAEGLPWKLATLDIRNKPELQERLAAEYALGTLRGAARARLRRWMREDAALARAVSEWEARLAPMAETVAARRPRARVWKEIEARLGPEPVVRGPGRRGFWRGLGLVAGGALAALAFMVVVLPGLQSPRGEQAYVALLTEPKTQRPVLYISAMRDGTELRVRSLDPKIHVSDASLELWALPRGGKPKSLGLVASADRSVIRLAAGADLALGDVPMLAVSLEPKGGSPTGLPTGPVLYSGPCIKDW
jgi:anti-sigma-K factor RskA